MGEGKLSARTVEELFVDCMFRAGEATDDCVVAEGITINVGFHPGRLEGHAEEIGQLLMQLDENFHEDKGGGWSFSQACMDGRGEMWTSLHVRVEQLFLLGMATGQATCLMPRETWFMAPGGVPYYSVKARA